MKATWTAKIDMRDDTAKGGYRRIVLVNGKVFREQADAAVAEAVAQHVAETGHTVDPTMTFPGKTHVSCGTCRMAFHATGLKES